jgi:NAD(P)-dependent dehydrogenase (short-subunit alcohol dehydrogenase family)
MPLQPRRKVLITGAAGGMGRAVARLFGSIDDLVLTDVSAASLDKFATELRTDGYIVVAHAGDMSDEGLIATLVKEVAQGGNPFAVVHTAGLSPSLADWQTIMQVNLVATEKLLRALEPALVPGSVAVLIASSAGHMFPPMPEVEAVLAQPLAQTFMATIEGVIQQMGGGNSPGGMGGISYSLSKKAVHNICTSRALIWGPKGARIISLSPGMIATPMGKSEIANTSGAQELLDATPVGRASAAAMDIALAAQFLCSNAASFISGTDLLVDGGGTAGMKLAMARG